MNGPEHYREAERLIESGERVMEEIRAAKGDEACRDALGKQAVGTWQQAQVHATLALADAIRKSGERSERSGLAIAKEINRRVGHGARR